MSPKNLFLIFLLSAHLPINNSIKAMENPCKKIRSNNYQRDLEFGQENEYGEEPTFSTVHEIDINDHCKFLTQFKENKKFEFLEVTEENLGIYHKSLLSMLSMQHPDLNTLLFIFHQYFRHILASFKFNNQYNKHITLTSINALLSILIQHFNIEKNIDSYIVASTEEQEFLDLIVYNAIKIKRRNRDVGNALLRLLIRNNLIPPLDHIIDGKYVLTLLVINDINIELFRHIINKEKDKNYPWHDLFGKQTNMKDRTILHHAAMKSKEIAQILLDLIKEKDLPLDDFLLIPDAAGNTPVDLAYNRADFEIVQLFNNKDIESDDVNSFKSIISLAIGKHNLIDQIEYLPQELQEYCRPVAKISQYCILLEELVKEKGNEFPNYVPQYLHVHKKLLYKLCNSEYHNLDLIYNIFISDLQEACDNDNPKIYMYKIIFNNINIILTMINNHIMTQKGIDKVNDKIEEVIIRNIRKKRYAGLFLLLILGDLSSNYIFDEQDLLQLTIDDKCDPNMTILHAAALYGSTKVFKILLRIMTEKHCDLNFFLNKRDSKGNTPLMIAESKGKDKIVKLLLKLSGY